MSRDRLFQSFHSDPTTEDPEQQGTTSILKRLLSSKVLYWMNVCLSVAMCMWVATLFVQLCKEAFTRTSYRFVPYPRETIGLFGLLPLYKTDWIASATPIVIAGAVLLSWLLFLTGFLVPGSLLMVLVLYISSYYLCEQSSFGYGFKETTAFQ
ncbi:hypothetical protein WA556_002333, partial [Blastocystis sp. ATCC 50177/Nand II]